MKSKHAITRIKGLSVWQKIFCTLIAASLLALMIPNGLRANADENQSPEQPKPEQKQLVQTETKTEAGADEGLMEDLNVGVGDLLSMESIVHIDGASFNMEQTAGTFTVQTATATVQQIAYDIIKEILPSETYKQTGSITREDFARILKAVNDCVASGLSDNAAPGGSPFPFDQLKYTEETGKTSVDVDMTKALAIPQFIKDMEIEGFAFLPFINSIIPSNTYNWFFPDSLPNDGAFFMVNLFLGEGNDILEIIRNCSVRFTRVVPVIPALYHGDEPVPFMQNNLLCSENQNNAEDGTNVQAYFMNWYLDLWETDMYMPLSWWQKFYDNPELISPINHYPLPIHALTEVRAQAMFWDVEGMVPVHLDFSGAYVFDDLIDALYEDGWYTTNYSSHTVWTKTFHELTPTWYIYSDIFTKFGDYIFSPRDTSMRPYANQCVAKDHFIRDVYNDKFSGAELVWDYPPFPGPHSFESDNDNWAGSIGKETTFKFSVYPVSPRGAVTHEGHGENLPETLLNVADPVDQAFVMFYDENDTPLFNFWDARYDKDIVMDAPGELKVYCFKHIWFFDPDTPAIGYYTPQWCFDTQIDHAVVYAWDERGPSTIDGFPNIYVPLRVDWDEYDPSYAAVYNDGYCSFNVERLMMGEIDTLINDGIESFKVEYFEDGNLIAEPFTISDPWEIAWFGLPLVTHGTITTWRNTLVSGFGCFMDYNNPFGDADPAKIFQDMDNFTVTNTQHWYQCRITANARPGYEFSTWYYDGEQFSADVEGAGEDPIIIKETALYPYHLIRAGFNQVAGVVNSSEAAGTAIYGDEAATPVAATPDGNAPVIASNPTAEGTAQTGDSAPLAPIAALAIVAALGCCLAIRKLYTK